MASTKYTLEVQTEKNGEFVATDFSRSTKATVVAEGDARRKAEKVGYRVVTASGTVVAEASKPNQRVITFFTKPYTRTQEVGEAAALLPEGYVSAYARPRGGAVLGRNMNAPKDARYVVVDERTNETLGFAPTTRAAGAIMTALTAKRKAEAAVTS